MQLSCAWPWQVDTSSIRRLTSYLGEVLTLSLAGLINLLKLALSIDIIYVLAREA